MEKIKVVMRMRPLNKKEQKRKDKWAWGLDERDGFVWSEEFTNENHEF